MIHTIRVVHAKETSRGPAGSVFWVLAGGAEFLSLSTDQWAFAPSSRHERRFSNRISNCSSVDHAWEWYNQPTEGLQS